MPIWPSVFSGRLPARLSGQQLGLRLLIIPVLTCILGSLFFIPYNALAYGVSTTSAAFFHTISFAVAGGLCLLNYRPGSLPRDRLLLMIPLIWLVSHVFLYIAKWQLFWNIDAQGMSTATDYSQGLYAGNLAAVLAGLLVSFSIVLLAHPARIGHAQR